MRKSEEFTHSIDWYKDKTGIVNFKIVPYEESENALLSFNTYTSARERLEGWLDQETLCLKYCNLAGEEAVCFNHQIKKCNGICAGEEEIEDYNKRAQNILREFIFKDQDFIIMDRGRTNEERSIILIRDGKYKGYGYFDSTSQISSPDGWQDIVKQSTYYPDTDTLIKGWLRSHNGHKIYPLPKVKDVSDF